MTVAGECDVFPVPQRGFRLGLPEEFFEIPVDETEPDPTTLDRLSDQVAERFGIPPTDETTLAAATAFANLGSLIGDTGGVDYSAMAFYKSPDDPMRPIMVTLTGIALPSEHQNASEAVKGLFELHSESGAEAVERLQLPAGPAIATVTEEQNALVIDGEAVHLLTRQLSAWVPDRDGTTIAIVSVMTNSFRDWERVCVLALDIFDSFGWEPLSG